MVLHYLGELLALIGLLMLVPLGVSVVYQEPDWLAFLTSALLTGLVGATLWYWTRRSPGPLRRKESFLVVALPAAIPAVERLFGAA